MMDVFIGVDVGTQGTKAIAYRPALTANSSAPKLEGRILARASASYSLLSTDVAGRAEQDPSDWIGAVRLVLKELVTDLELVAAASPTSSSPTSDGRQRHCVLRGIGISDDVLICEDALAASPFNQKAGPGTLRALNKAHPGFALVLYCVLGWA